MLAAAVISAGAATPAKKLQAGTDQQPSVKTATTVLTPAAKAPKGTAAWPKARRVNKNANPFLKSRNTVTYRPQRTAPGPYRAASTLPANAVISYSDTWTQENSPIGLYSIPTSGSVAAFTPIFINEDFSGNLGVVPFDGKMLSLYQYEMFGMTITYLSIIDLSTGETIDSGMIDNPTWSAFDLTYDETTGRAYGAFGNLETGATFFGTMDPENLQVTPVKTYTDGTTLTGTGIAADGTMYAMDAAGNFYTVNKATGDLTLVKATGIVTQYITTGTFDNRTGRFYYASSLDQGSAFYAIDTAGNATKVYDMPDEEQLNGMFMPAPAAADKAPAAVDDLTVTFPSDALSGTVAFTLPSTLYDGTAATGEMTWTVTANDSQVATGSAQAGTAVSAPVTLTESGTYTFTVTASNATGTGPKTKTTLYVGTDTPMAATGVGLVYTGGTATLTWTAPTEGENGATLDPASLAYRITRHPGDVVVAASHTSTTFTEAYPEPEQGLEALSYTVETLYKGQTSDAVRSNSVVLGTATPPFATGFDTKDDFAMFSVVDNNGDGRTWEFANSQARYIYSGANNADDYLITPAIRLQAGKNYILSFDTYGYSKNFPERVAAYLGTAPTAAAMTTCLVTPTDIANDIDSPEHISVAFSPETDGTYYIGIKACSDADAFYLYVDNFSLSAPLDNAAPAAVTGLTVTPDPAGAAKATVSFTAPSKNMGGGTLTSLDKVEIYREGSEQPVATLNPAIGAAASWTDENAPAGTVTYTVIPSNASGAGLSATATAYIGFDVPATPASFKAASGADFGEVVFTWDPVTADVNGLPLPAGAVTYTIVRIEDDNSQTTIAEDITANTFTHRECAADAEQKLVQYALFPATTAGFGKGIGSGVVPVGAPYTLPFFESFADAGLSHDFAIGGMATPSVIDDTHYSDVKSSDGDNGFFEARATAAGQTFDLLSSRIDLGQATAPELSFYYFGLGSEDQNTLEVLIDAGEGFVRAESVFALSNGVEDQWNRITVPLAAFKGKAIRFQLHIVFNNYAGVLLDCFTIDQPIDHNLAAGTITAPANVKAGDPVEVSLKVSNFGANAADSYTVDFFCGADKFATVTGPALATGASAVVKAEYPTNIATPETLEFHAIVNYSADGNMADNTSESVTVKVTKPNHPTPTALEANVSESGVNLTWTAPDLTPGAPTRVTEDFESCESFAIGSAAGWTFIDLDGAGVGGFQGIDIPNVPTEETASFFVFDNSDTNTFNQYFAAHSGNKYLAALFNYAGEQNDDWAISPELTGTAQTISFFARSYNDQYPDAFEVLYSTGSMDPADFNSLGTVNAVPGAWTEYSYDLPEGAKRFAIRFIATDSFMLMVDDITFTVAGGDFSGYTLEGYNVYCDGVKLNGTPVTSTAYLHADPTEGPHTYRVTAVYTAQGESAPTAPVTVDLSALDNVMASAIDVRADHGAILVTAPDGTAVTVADMAGRILHSGAGSCRVEVASGAVYAVKAGRKAFKIAVK